MEEAGEAFGTIADRLAIDRCRRPGRAVFSRIAGELAEFIEASVQERGAMARGRVETLERDLAAAQAAIGEWERALQDAENRVAMEGQKRAEAVALAEEQVKIREETERRATRLQWLLFTAVVLLIALGFF